MTAVTFLIITTAFTLLTCNTKAPNRSVPIQKNKENSFGQNVGTRLDKFTHNFIVKDSAESDITDEMLQYNYLQELKQNLSTGLLNDLPVNPSPRIVFVEGQNIVVFTGTVVAPDSSYSSTVHFETNLSDSMALKLELNKTYLLSGDWSTDGLTKAYATLLYRRTSKDVGQRTVHFKIRGIKLKNQIIKELEK